MKKILIWDNRKLANIGGPSGYLYNIYKYLKRYPNSQIVFLSEVLNTNSSICEKKIKSSNRFIVMIKQIINICYRFYYGKITQMESINLNEYDYIHFHTVLDALKFINSNIEYNGKIILTSHCPCLWIDEFLSSVPWLKFLRPIGLYNELKCYKKVDYIMFPCKEAREPYEKESKVKEIFCSNEQKFIYVPSSINDLNIDIENIQKLSDLGIPNDAFVITYFGRHNKIKGYDILKKLGKDLLKQYPNLYFVCAGKGEIQPLNHKRWIELGFISNTHELLYQSDLYVLPNRETYFDLVVLEILRSGTNLILSLTGGNKFFLKFTDQDEKGLFFFDISNYEQLVSLVKKSIESKNMNIQRYRKNGIANRNIYLNNFTVDLFIERYLKEINQLL